MSDNCKTCDGKISGRHNIRCAICSGVSHLNCIKPSIPPEMLKFPGFMYKCSSCSDGRPGDKTSDNYLPKLMDTLSTLNSKIDNLQADVNVVKNQQKSVTESLTFYGNKIDDFSKQITDFETKLKIIPKLESNLTSVSSSLNTLQVEMNQIQQQARLNNLEINGIPETSNENLITSVNQILNVLGLTSSTYNTCFRVPHFDSKNKNPRSVIVKMHSQADKDNVIAAVKKRKGVKLNEIGFSNTNPIFLNDHLTPTNKLLYKKNSRILQKFGSCMLDQRL
ncbi:hypothetical protein NQ317_006872 [Molorchus minor]|uniref:Zinc finger PHD-type domain-containing protein n=1 Tax=Molorchus minor TaxID=1323400 RepID=A0ABQ9JV70_9CUCU|nr:hypothetical protein NQ317_006872 [Molorchus minor]